MRKALLSMALLAGSLLSASAQTAADRVTAFVKPGPTQWLAIQLNNANAEYTAFQMDITLPENLTFAGEVQLKRQGTEAPHKAFFNEVDGVLKVVAFSAESYEGDATITKGNDIFSGTSGDLLLVKVTAADGVVYKNIQLSVPEGESTAIGKVKFVNKDLNEVTMDAYVAGLLGDVNGDNRISEQDASLVLQNAVGKIADNEEGYEVVVANANGDSKVSEQDASLVLQYAVGKITSFE